MNANWMGEARPTNISLGPIGGLDSFRMDLGMAPQLQTLAVSTWGIGWSTDINRAFPSPNLSWEDTKLLWGPHQQRLLRMSQHGMENPHSACHSACTAKKNSNEGSTFHLWVFGAWRLQFHPCGIICQVLPPFCVADVPFNAGDSTMSFAPRKREDKLQRNPTISNNTKNNKNNNHLVGGFNPSEKY